MGRLPPADKLPLAVRKNVRDEWENNKADLERQLSEVLGTPWTIDINPNSIWPYHGDGYAKDSLGSCIKSYIEGAIFQLKYVGGKLSLADFNNELNAICHAHVLTLDLEDSDPPRFSYGGCDVTDDGKLRILFVEGYLGTNMDYCLQDSVLIPALNAAPPGPTADKSNPLSFLARINIRLEYDAKIDDVRRTIATLLGKPEEQVTLNPNFADTFAKLRAAGSNAPSDWEKNFGESMYRYFDALAFQMKYIKVGEDDMVREGLLEAVSTNEYAFRIVDKLRYESYCEVVVEDGVLYLQSTASTWGINTDYVASKLMDQL